jgi:hypothetical protein
LSKAVGNAIMLMIKLFLKQLEFQEALKKYAKDTPRTRWRASGRSEETICPSRIG